MHNLRVLKIYVKDGEAIRMYKKKKKMNFVIGWILRILALEKIKETL